MSARLRETFSRWAQGIKSETVSAMPCKLKKNFTRRFLWAMVG
jgi:hypothetical protein